MYRFVKSLLAAALALVGLAAAVAQGTPGFEPVVCGADADMELKCLDACIICDIDGFSGRNDNGGALDEGDMPRGFCTSINHNIQWIGFLATDSNLTLALTVTDCENGASGGLEAGVYYVEECDRAGATPVATCNSAIDNGASTEFAMTDLVAGQYYYFVIDGNDGGICDYRIDVVSGSTRVPDLAFRQNEPVVGPRRVCPGSTHDFTGEAVDGAPVATWTVDGVRVGTASRELTRAVTFPDVAYDTVEVCYTARNLCNEVRRCVEVIVGDPGTRVEVPLCYGESRTVGGVTLDATGEVAVTRVNRAGCDSVVTYAVEVAREITGPPANLNICSGGSVVVQGITYTEAASFDAVYQAASGCDSAVATTITVAPPPPETRAVVLCDGVAVTRDGLTFTAADTAAPRTITVTEAGGCQREVTYVTGVAPRYELRVPHAFCTGEALVVDGVTYPRPGEYPLQLRSSRGCDSVVTLVITSEDCPFEGEVSPSHPRCHGGSDGAIAVEVDGDYPPYTLQLSRGGQSVGDPVRQPTASFVYAFPGLPAGAYRVDVVDALGATAAYPVVLTDPAPLTLALGDLAARPGESGGGGGYDLACAGDRTGALAARPGGGTGAYVIAWADAPGLADVERAGLPAGAYRCTVRDANGCRAEAEATLTEPAPLTLAVEAFDRGCDSLEPGGLVVADFAGGVAPYTYHLGDAGAAEPLPAAGATVTPLAPGPHALTVVDANGCATVRSATVGALAAADVSAGPTVTVFRGDPAALSATSTQAGVTYAWAPVGVPEPAYAAAATLDCAACDQTAARPDTTMRYRVTAVNADGCAAEAEQLVVVEVDRALWAPNAISPNGDERNDGFTVFANDPGSVIEELRIFDRWGDLAYATTDLPANDPSLGWSGHVEGEPANGAVFVYWARVRASDGATQVLAGDVTVVR